MIYKSVLALLASLSAMACDAQEGKGVVKYEFKGETQPAIPTKVVKRSIADLYFLQNSALSHKIDSIYLGLTDEEKAAQMIMVASSEVLGFPYKTTVLKAVKGNAAANVLFLKGSKADFKAQEKVLKDIQANGLSPLFACDCEPTLLHNKFVGEKKMLATAALKDATAVNSSVDTINRLMDEMGIQVNFAPILDIAANKSIINKRAFGNDPVEIVSLSSAFINATQYSNKLATVKHFPGHGAVEGDTHKQSVSIKGKLTELPTFRKVIAEAKPVFVMVGHIAVKQNNEGYNTEGGRPATTSRKIVTDLLRNEMGFQGIITTDAMNMQASKNMPDADWEAAKAGVDLVLMPLNPSALNKKISAEIEKGSDLGKQFEASVKRIIKLKIINQNL